MRKLLFYGIFSLIVLVLSSCVQDVVLDAGEKPTVAVGCVLTDEAIQTLYLSFTKGASLSEAPPLTEATATLTDKETGKTMPFHRKQGNEWTLEYAAVPTHHYRLEVEVPGYEKIWAEQTMPEPAAFQCVQYVQFEHYIEPWSGWDEEILYEDIEGVHKIRRWPEGEAYPDYETFYILYASFDPIWLYAMGYNPLTGRREPAQEICANILSDERNLIGKEYNPPQKDIPNPYKLNEDFLYKPWADSFRKAHQLELYPLLAGAPMHEQFLRLLSGEEARCFMVAGSFDGKYCREKPCKDDTYDYNGFDNAYWNWGYATDIKDDEGYLLAITCSFEYDKYLLEAYQYQRIQASTDLSTIYLRDNIYSNIVGGIGIFGARTERKYPWAETYVYVDSGIELRETPFNEFGGFTPPTVPK